MKTKIKETIALCFLLLVLLVQSCQYENKEELFADIQQEDCIETEAAFAIDIVPLLINHCNACHRNDRRDGDVNLEGYDNVKPYADDGSLYGTTNHEAGYSMMPTSGEKIPFCEIEKLRLWIEAGALDN